MACDNTSPPGGDRQEHEQPAPGAAAEDRTGVGSGTGAEAATGAEDRASSDGASHRRHLQSIQRLAAQIRRNPMAIYSVDKPEEMVPLLPVQELLFAIQEIGVGDAADLVALTTPEQFRAFLDLSVWTRDQVEPEEMEDWLRLLLDLDDDDFMRKMRELDPELLAATLGRLCFIMESLEEGEPESEVAPYTTVDTFYLVYPRPPEPDPDTGEIDEGRDPGADPDFHLAVQLIDRVYRSDLDMGRMLVMEVLSGTRSEHEEFAYRWRSGRVADMGYETFADAIGLLQFLDPVQVARGLEAAASSGDGETRPGDAAAAAAAAASVYTPDPDPPEPDPAEPSTIGGVLLEPWGPPGEEPFLEACLDALGEAERERVTLGFTYLANRLAAATLVRPGDAEAMRQVLTRARRGMNLGLEYLTGGRPERGPAVLGRLAAATVFRVGYSLGLHLQRLVSTLSREGRISLARTGATLLDPPWLDLADGLTRRFPELTRAFDEPPAGGYRPLLTLADIAMGARLVEDLAHLWPLCFVGLGFSPRWLTEAGLEGCLPSEPGAVRLGDLFRTAALQALLGGALDVAPLTDAQVAEATARLADLSKQPGAWLARVTGQVRERLEAAGHPVPPRLDRTVALWLAPLLSGQVAGHILRQR